MRKVLLRTLAGLVVVQLALALYAWRCWSPGAPTFVLPAARLATPLPHRLRDGPEHDVVRERFGEPYVLELERLPGALLYYGAYHARDREDPQVADVRARWAAFRPTVALCEGRSRGHFLGRLLPRFVGLSEPAVVHGLARRDGVPLHSLEPSYADEVAALLAAGFTAPQVALYFTMRVYASESGGRADEDLALELLRKRTDVDGLRGSLTSVEDLDAAWADAVGDGSDWRTDARERSGSVLAAISDASRRVRGEHMARALIELVERGERVFAVVGSGHVIRQEWALRAALGAEPAFDQPSGD